MKSFGLDIVEGSYIKNLAAPAGAQFPDNPNEAELFFNTQTNTLFVYGDGQWSSIVTTSTAQFNEYVAKVGSTMTGPLILSGPPTDNLQAATKGYVDISVAGIDFTPYIQYTGGVMTGPLTLAGTPTSSLHAAPKSYVDTEVSALNTSLSSQLGTFVQKSGSTLTGFLTLHSDPLTTLQAATKGYVDSAITNAQLTVNGSFLPLSGGTLTGMLELPAFTPSIGRHATSKDYVDSRIISANQYTDNAILSITSGGYLSLTGGTITGFLTLHSDPTANLHAATKSYVDAAVSAFTIPNHNSTLNIQGGAAGDYRHITTSEYTALSGMISSWNSNSGTFGTAGSFDHGNLNGLQGGSTGQRFHLSQNDHNSLVSLVPNIPVLARLNIVNTFTAQQQFSGERLVAVGAPVALTDAANKQYVDSEIAQARNSRVFYNNSASGTITIDWNSYDEARLLLAGNVIITMTNGYNGQKVMLRLKQDAVGGRTVTFSGNVRYGTDLTGYTPSIAPNLFDRVGFVVDALDGRYDLIAIAKGF